MTRLTGCLRLLAIGALFGLSVPLSRLAAEIESHPVGLALWVNMLVGAMCLLIAVCRRSLPIMHARLLRFVCLWGMLGVVGGDVLLFWVVPHLPASTVSIILVCEGFIVYACLLLRGKVRTSRRSLIGLVMGMLGILMLIGNGDTIATAGEPVWILLALSIPAVFAAEDFLICSSMTEDSDFLALTGYSAILGSMMLLPVAWFLNDFIALSWVPSQLEIAIVCIALSSALGTFLMVQLMVNLGALYGSQTGYTITFAGVVWSIVLLGERLSLGTLLALVLLILGLLCVEPVKKVMNDVGGRASWHGFSTRWMGGKAALGTGNNVSDTAGKRVQTDLYQHVNRIQ
ncbi:DMT family transporter [Granulosicoccus sp. 3-233]|uniref:DMT family transporter n=1 Tax=Granulosicoccus sp. 3-233 TaxID=3417969 RepID=UPI003D32581D